MGNALQYFTARVAVAAAAAAVAAAAAAVPAQHGNTLSEQQPVTPLSKPRVT